MDYSNWVLRDDFRATFVYGPKQTPNGDWHYLVEFESGDIEQGNSYKRLTELFEPPVVWAYYQAVRGGLDGRGDQTLHPAPDAAHATHRSKDGGDTIERIRDE